MAANNDSPRPCRLFLTDKKTKTRYLIDTGSDISVYPHQQRRRNQKEKYELYAANGSTIATYGSTNLQPDFGLRRDFPWRFIIADVTTPIIGSDFLAYYHLLPDVRRGCLVDGQTGLRAKGRTQEQHTSSIKAINEESPYHHILKEFPDITRQSGTAKCSHNTVHYINTTPGPPEACRPRRLAPDKLKAAKIEFELLL
ncbi:uncharacterized protein [Temnothorax longispinosus]|uniref:uncharacterized protein n=1 Tax=Temnothorax longispinosus TaxID=300112 RepID=UPI003A98FD9B